MHYSNYYYYNYLQYEFTVLNLRLMRIAVVVLNLNNWAKKDIKAILSFKAIYLNFTTASA